MRLLITDHSKVLLSALGRAISEIGDFEVEPFYEGAAALSRASEETFALIIVGPLGRQMTGVELIRRLRLQEHHQDVPILFMKARGDRSEQGEALEAGATDFLCTPSNIPELRTRLKNLIEYQRTRSELNELIRVRKREHLHFAEKVLMLERETIWCLSQVMNAHDGSTGNHVQRVAVIAELLGTSMGLDAALSRHIGIVAPLHDIGKVGVRDAILMKPGKLTKDEINQMRLHVEIGSRILGHASSGLARVAASIISGHHEKWDGTGYPKGLKGTSIPLAARIVAVADVFDALCSERPYKPAWPLDRAYDEILACSGSHFDPDCVEAFKASWPKIELLYVQKSNASSASDWHTAIDKELALKTMASENQSSGYAELEAEGIRHAAE